jgi:hypothetical protein
MATEGHPDRYRGSQKLIKSVLIHTETLPNEF